ncbi:alginate lyase family protein [Mucilaginibacter sp. UR6-1]|uniref:alginate lyase family protein n=1 Tax=Mucilaginibacter sp. UR6-1 TaxID=1435643 RepID=UPI001E637E1A|nr:alginate lyase family protein [Mucilaginibacter sp. UR6-1]MCC8408491.1 alginate lyase family protein [Mucilaginibacter sp. UR6-1]
MFNNTVDGFIDKNIGSLLSPYPTTVYVRSSGSTPTETKMRTDAQLAYALALKWAKTHDTTIVIKAIEVLNGWAYNFNKLDTVKGTFGQQRFLEAAWVVPTFAAAAEIIRWYNVNDDNTSLWPPEDITQFEAFLRKMMYEYADKTFASGFKNNWYVSAAYAKMAASVFLNDIAGYNNGYDRLKEILPLMILNDGTLPEFCSRTDCVHFQYSLTGITLGAELDRIQSGSTELYEYGGRIGKGYAFMSKVYSGGANGCNFCDPTKEVYPGVAVAYRYFANDNTTFLTTLKQPTYGVNADKTFLGFTMYTHYNVP